MIVQKVTSYNNDVEKVEYITLEEMLNDYRYFSTNINYDLEVNNDGFTLENSNTHFYYSYEIMNKEMSEVIL